MPGEIAIIWAFAIQDQGVPCVAVSLNRDPVVFDWGPTRSDQVYAALPHPRLVVDFAEESEETLTQCFVSLEIDSKLPHHRVPPSSPFLQSSPRVYRSSHRSSSLRLKRLSWVPASGSRSQMTTDSGWPESASTRASECVVTINCVRPDASTSASATT